jgi:hypothetical protein
MRSLLLLCCFALCGMLSAGPIEELLASRQICLTAGQILRVPAGTALPCSIQPGHPLVRLHNVQATSLSLVADLYVRGGDSFVSLDGSQWMPLEVALQAIFPGLDISSQGDTVILGLPG